MGDGSKTFTFKMNLCFFTPSHVCSNSLKMSKQCRQISLELISWGPHLSLEAERKICRCLFTFSINHAIRNFHVIKVLEIKNSKEINVQNNTCKCDVPAKLWVCLHHKLNLLHFCRFRCCRCPRCYSLRLYHLQHHETNTIHAQL